MLVGIDGPQNARSSHFERLFQRCRLHTLGLSKIRMWDSEKHSSPYSGKSGGTNPEFCVGLMLRTTAKCTLITWKSVSDSMLTEQFRTRMGNISIVQGLASTEASTAGEKEAFIRNWTQPERYFLKSTFWSIAIRCKFRSCLLRVPNNRGVDNDLQSNHYLMVIWDWGLYWLLWMMASMICSSSETVKTLAGAA